DVVAHDLLQGQCAVLGDVAEPGAFVEPLDEPTAPAARAGVLAQTRQHLQEVVGEAGERVGRMVLQRAEVHDEVDRLVVGPDVRAPIDPGLEDLEIGSGTFGHQEAPSWWGGSGFLRVRARRRRSALGDTSSAAMSRASWRRSLPASAISAASAGSANLGGGIRVRVVRSKREPWGRTCRITPLASSGEDRLAS